MEKMIIEDIKINVYEKLLKLFFVNSLKELGGYQNFIYELQKDHRSFIIRVTDGSHRSKEEILAEIKFLTILSKKSINIAGVIKYPYCEYVETIKTDTNTFFITVFEKAEGLNWYESTPNEQIYFNAGVTLGKIHQQAKQMDEMLHRTSWLENQYFMNLEQVTDDSIIIKKKHELIETLKTLKHDKNTYGLVHGDYNFANMMYNGDDITIYDFDELEYSWYVYDIAIYMFYYLLGGNPAQMDIEPNVDLFKVFMKGYLNETTISLEEIAKLPLFLRYREFVLLSSLLRLPTKGEWAKAFIEHATYRIKNDLPFIEIDFVEIFKGL